MGAIQAEERTATIPMERILDAQTASIVDQIKLLLQDLRAKGLDEDQIATLVRKDEGSGRVIIDRGYLVLKDEGGIKIRLTPMERTLYIFLAKHKDGVKQDELWRYWKELYKIYESQTVYGDTEMIADSVDALCEDDMATLRTNISRIKKKIKEKAGDWASQRYGIKRDDNNQYILNVVLD